VLNFVHRAMAGNKSIGENYSFSGVHHIFDQHKSAGLFVCSPTKVTSVSIAVLT
jgi:hypothetical protein